MARESRSNVATHEWATFIGTRRPKFKTHRTEALAKRAVNFKFTYKNVEGTFEAPRGGIIYQRVNGKWHEVASIKGEGLGV